jgi:hypothetical protein
MFEPQETDVNLFERFGVMLDLNLICLIRGNSAAFA